MPGTRRLRRGGIGVATLALVTLLRLTGVAQDVTEPALKAAFIYNFARFTEWPDPIPASEPFVFCVPRDPGVSDALERAIRGRELAGHRMVVSREMTAGPNRACQVLYLSGVTAGEAAKLIAGLNRAPVLTISDVEGFTKVGGIVQFFFEQGQMRFGIALESAQQARLRISSRLLILAQRHD